MEGEYSVLEHLGELRRRVVFSGFFLLLATVLSYPFSGNFLYIIEKSINFEQNNVSFIITNPLEAVSVKIKASMLLGVILSLPVLLSQLWAFLSPALSRKEKKLLLYSLVPSIVLFLAGVFFAYKILLPLTFSFLMSEAAPLATPMLSLEETYNLLLFILLMTGASFQLPVIAGVLSKVGVVNHRMLSKYRRHVIVLIILAAGIVTPDPTLFSQVVLSVPLVLLYEASILVSRLIK